MKVFKILIIICSIVLFGCSPLKKVNTLKSEADQEFILSNYEKAYNQYHELIKISEVNKIEIAPEVIKNMAFICNNLNKYVEAEKFYNKSLSMKFDSTMLASYINMLHIQGLNDKELAVWNQFSNEVNSSGLTMKSFERQIEIYNTLHQPDSITNLWNRKPGERMSASTYFSVVEAYSEKKNDVKAIATCNELLKKYPSDTNGIEWKAKYYYNKAEDRYKVEMDTYNKNKNQTSYAYLKRDLKKVSADYRTSRDLFLKLRQANPNEKEYIRYLVNIYLRLDNKSEASKYDKMLK